VKGKREKQEGVRRLRGMDTWGMDA